MEPQIGKLRWRCRRGMKELDLLLARYVDQEFARAAPPQQAAFQRLLDAQDPEIYAYFVGRAAPPDEELRTLIERITAIGRNDP